MYGVMGGRVIESEADRILNRGMREGRQQGMREGRQQAIREAIGKMLSSGKTPEQIADFCGYELPEVLAVQEEMMKLKT